LAGNGLNKLYQNSTYALITTEFPDYFLHPWNFNKLPIGWWDELARLIEGGDGVGETCLRLGLESLLGPAPPRTITSNHFRSINYDRVHRQLGDIRVLALCAFPESSERPRTRPADDPKQIPIFPLIANHKHQQNGTFWDSKENVRAYLEYLIQYLGHGPESLYSVSQALLVQTGGTT